MKLSETIGRRVINVWQEKSGVVTAIEDGCNGGALVLFDGRDYSVAMCLQDLALVDLYPGPGSRLSDMDREA